MSLLGRDRAGRGLPFVLFLFTHHNMLPVQATCLLFFKMGLGMRCALKSPSLSQPPAADGIRCPRQEIIAGVWSRTRQAGPTSPHALYPLISLLVSLPRRGETATVDVTSLPTLWPIEVGSGRRLGDCQGRGCPRRKGCR